MAKKRRKSAVTRGLLGPRGVQKRPGFREAVAATKKGAQGGGGSAGMRTIRGTGAVGGSYAPWMGDPSRGLMATRKGGLKVRKGSY